MVNFSYINQLYIQEKTKINIKLKICPFKKIKNL